MMVRTFPLLYSAAARSASDDQETKLATVTGMPCRSSLAAISSKPSEKIFSTPRRRKTWAPVAGPEPGIAFAVPGPIEIASSSDIACRERNQGRQRTESPPKNPGPPRYGFIGPPKECTDCCAAEGETLQARIRNRLRQREPLYQRRVSLLQHDRQFQSSLLARS